MLLPDFQYTLSFIFLEKCCHVVYLYFELIVEAEWKTTYAIINFDFIKICRDLMFNLTFNILDFLFCFRLKNSLSRYTKQFQSKCGF